MTPTAFIILLGAAMMLIMGGALSWLARGRGLERWAGSQIRQSIGRRISKRRARTGRVHVLLCIADHFEPAWAGAPETVADARVAAWVRDYPRLFGELRDSDGRPPRHTFFYPIDQYEPRHVDALAELCREGFGELEIQLHHDHDTAENLDETLRRFTGLFAERHGVLGRWPDGRVAYGFVHGNWALDNSRPDGRWCGVNNELDVLRRTGCYADFTLPSAPHTTQTRKINSIYYAVDDPRRPKSHDRGIDVGAAPPPDGGLMLIQGPLRLWRPEGSWKPRIENGCIQRGQAPSMARLNEWLRADVHISSRPEWVFVKLHTHGATEGNRQVVLGETMVDFHRSLAERASGDADFTFHYVTAREMYNLAKAAEAGWTGPVSSAVDFAVSPARLNNRVPMVLGME